MDHSQDGPLKKLWDESRARRTVPVGPMRLWRVSRVMREVFTVEAPEGWTDEQIRDAAVDPHTVYIVSEKVTPIKRGRPRVLRANKQKGAN